MPLYEYLCPQGHRQEDFTHLAVNAPDLVACRTCGQDAGRIPSLPATMTSSLVPGVGRVFGSAPVTGAKNIWEGTKLADGDGKNRAHYHSDRIQVDLGG